MSPPASRAPSTQRDVWLALGFVACAAYLGWAISKQAWVTDDALITFRYVDNLVSGRGLVFNAGERVESFSSPLFVLLLAPLRALKADPFTASKILGSAF